MAAAERSGDAGGRRRPYAAARRSAIHFTAVLVLAFVHRCDARFAVLPPHVDSNPGWTYEVGGDAAADWRISPDTVAAAAAAASGVGDDAMQDAVSPWWWPVDTDYPRHHRTKSHKYAGERLSSNSVWKRRILGLDNLDYATSVLDKYRSRGQSRQTGGATSDSHGRRTSDGRPSSLRGQGAGLSMATRLSGPRRGGQPGLGSLPGLNLPPQKLREMVERIQDMRDAGRRR